MKKKLTKHTLLVGEGTNQHTLYGNFAIDLEIDTDFPEVLVKNDSDLKHEKPNGAWSNEHKTLRVDKGSWVMGKQVEYNPFNREVTRIWD
jgi:hypothetical protein